MSVCIVSAEKTYARFLELELGEMTGDIRVITEKLSMPALTIAVDECSLLVFDAQYYLGDLAFVEQRKLPTIVIKKSGQMLQRAGLPNIVGIFERPFAIDDLKEKIMSISDGGLFLPQTRLSAVGEIVLDQFKKEATINGMTFRFSPKEFLLLSLLYKNRGRTVSRQTVISTIWGEDYDLSNNVDNVYINYLRKKLDEKLGVKLIYTIRGKGYMMK